MLIRAADRPAISAPDDDLVMWPLVRAEDAPDLSVTRVRLTGRHRPLRTLRSTRVYYVLEGSATFTVGGRSLEAARGDVVVVPAGERYALEGDLEYLVVNAPAYRPGDDRYDGEA